MRRTTAFGLLLFLFFNNVFAAAQLDPGNFQLEVNGVLLDIEAVSTIDNISFSGNTFTVTMSSSQNFKISSSEKRNFSVSPSTYASRTCPANKSVLEILIPANISPIDYAISLGAPGSCSDSGGGGAGGGGEAPAAPPPPPPPTPPPTPPPPTPPPPPPTPPPTPPPPPPPAPTPAPAPPAPAPAPSAGPSAGGGGGGAIASGAVQIVSSISSGVTEIFRGITTGSAGSAYIARCAPNSGSYQWNTGQPIFTDSGTVLKLTDGDNYKVKLIHCADASLQDESDAPFSLSSAPLSQNSKGINGELFAPEVFAQAEMPRFIKVISPNGGERWRIGQTYPVLWESQNIPETNLVNIILNKGIDLAGSFKVIGTEVNQAVEELRANPEVTRTVKEVTAPAAVAVTVVSAGALTVTASAGSVTIAINLSEFLQALSFSRFYLLGLLRFRRKKPWGKVIDKLSGKPIQSATVQIYDAEFNKLKDSQITDADGRFNALITPGKYYILVSRKGYEPYQAGGINISSPEEILALEIYLSPAKEEWSMEYLKRINIWNAIKRFIELINPYLLAFGTVVSVVSLIIVPNLINYLTFGVYILFDLLKIYFAFHLLNPFGRVADETTGEWLPLTVVRIFEEERNWLLATKVTDDRGRFSFLLAPGKYYITCARAGYQTFQSDSIILEKAGLPALNVKLKRTE